VIAGLAALGATLSGSLAPASYAQTAPSSGLWSAGPDAAGANTIVGRIETPTRTQNIANGASVLLSGWAADTTAQGWAGIDAVEVWSGDKAKGGTKLAAGTVGLNRTDVADFLGPYFGKAGFNAVIPASALKDMKPGATSVNVYLHTPNKGSYLRATSFNLGAPAPALAFEGDPILVVSRPQEGMAITQRQPNNKFTFNGFALDRNAEIAPANATLGPGCSACTLYSTQSRPAGIASVTINIDGTDPVFPNFGSPCPGCVQTTSPLVANKGNLNVPGKPQGSFQSRQYGDQYDFSGWSASINPALLAPGWHTLNVTATSAVTGKKTTANVTFNILDQSHLKVQP